MRHQLSFLSVTKLVACAIALATTACVATDEVYDDVVVDDGKSDAARSARLIVPLGEGPRPLVLSLHGYSSNGASITEYFGLEALAHRENFLLAIPEGTSDHTGNQFWNTGEACCDFFDSGVDDLGYLTRLIDSIEAKHAVSHVYVIGHSNGAIMAHRLGCSLSDRIDGIVSLSGTTPVLDICAGRGVPMLEIHSDQDLVISYNGGNFGLTAESAYTSAPVTAATWAVRNRCVLQIQEVFEIDLDTAIEGTETRVDRFCPAVELWTVQGGGHSPTVGPDFASRVYSFLRRAR